MAAVKLRHNGFLPLLAVAVVFTLYDVLVQRRQRHVVDKAERTNQLVSTLFPSSVRDRLLGQNSVHDDVMFQDDNRTVHSNLTGEYLEKTKVTGEMGPVDPTNPYETKPIADLFPEATVRKFASFMDTIKVMAVPMFVTLTLLFFSFRGYRWLHRLEFCKGTHPGTLAFEIYLVTAMSCAHISLILWIR
jgi:hypothetical protein